MKIIKRSGSEDIFDAAKIVAAIRKANDSVLDYEKLTADQIEEIASNVETACENMKRSPSVEEIQDSCWSFPALPPRYCTQEG